MSTAEAKRAIAEASVTITGGLPEVRLSWLFLSHMRHVMTHEEWRSYLRREDEVRVR